MQSQSQLIITASLTHLFAHFWQQLQIRKLVRYIPQYNQNYITKIGDACTRTMHLEEPKVYSKIYVRGDKLEQEHQFIEDDQPKNIQVDQFANGSVRKIQEEDVMGQIVKAKQEIKQRDSKHSHMYRKTNSQFRGTYMSKLSKILQNPQKCKEKQSQQTERTFQQLKPNPPIQQQIELQYELRSIQKKLYYTRNQKKMQEIREKQRLEGLKKRKSPQLPRTDYTYQFDGKFIKRNNRNKQSFPLKQMKVSHSFDMKQKNKKSLAEFLQSSNLKNLKRGASQSQSRKESRYQKNSTYNNENKRQISHLPFLKIADNSRFKEQGRVSEGKLTERTSPTWKQFSDSVELKGFKHHSEAQQAVQNKQSLLIQKLQAKRLERFQQQHQFEEINKNPQQPQNSQSSSHVVHRRQSYLMDKYLKKLKQQQERTGITDEGAKKSYNFNRVNYPKASAIHEYYRYDFNEEKKKYESEADSRAKALDQQ